jgi:hypothetical protein
VLSREEWEKKYALPAQASVTHDMMGLLAFEAAFRNVTSQAA